MRKQLSILILKNGHLWDLHYMSILEIKLCLIQSELNGAKKGMNQL